VKGAENLKLPAKKPSGGPSLIPKSVSATKGERRVINGQMAEWDGQGWVAVGP